jgi:hypothetical protein
MEECTISAKTLASRVLDGVREVSLICLFY